MALTPEDVRNKLFTTVRLREGYEQTEVDEFLDEVEAELTRLLAENDDLRAKAGDAVVEHADGGAPAVTDLAPARPDVTLDKTPEPEPVRQSPQEIVVRTSSDVSVAATRVLEMAQRTADQYLGEAREEADKLVSDAKSTAEQLSGEARRKADDIDRQTHERTSALAQQLDMERAATLGTLQDQKRRLESEIETLRSFEREYRGRLRTFLEGQLSQLSSRAGDDTPLAPSGGPAPASAGDAAAGDQPADPPSADGADTAGAGQAVAGDEAETGSADGRQPSPGRRSREGSRSALGRILDEEDGSDDRS